MAMMTEPGARTMTLTEIDMESLTMIAMGVLMAVDMAADMVGIETGIKIGITNHTILSVDIQKMTTTMEGPQIGITEGIAMSETVALIHGKILILGRDSCIHQRITQLKSFTSTEILTPISRSGIYTIRGRGMSKQETRERN